jgi:hypothetical protein
MIVLGFILLITGLLLHISILWIHPLDVRDHPGSRRADADADGLDGARSGPAVVRAKTLRNNGFGHSGIDPKY